MVDTQLRRRRLKAVFEGRKLQLSTATALVETPDRKRPRRYQYARAVAAYTRARTAWRAIRGRS